MQIHVLFPLPGNISYSVLLNNLSMSKQMYSVSSDGSAESHLVEQEDIIALTQVPFIKPSAVNISPNDPETHIGCAPLQRGAEQAAQSFSIRGQRSCCR